MEFTGILLFVLVGLAFWIVIKGFVVIRQSQVAVVERMGKYLTTLEAGWHIIIPFIDSIRANFDMREALHDFEPQAVITQDNATVRINAVTYFRVTDPKMAAYEVQNFEAAMGQLIITTLRNLIGEMDLDLCLNGRNTINSKLQVILDEATHAWGVKVTRVELKEITPMGEVADAMDKQMVAERTRRAQILEAEGSKSAAILQAEGAKSSSILRAEGEREVVLIRAKAEAEAAVVSAQAQRDAIREVLSAFGPGADEKYLQLKYLEALPEMANGKGATVFMPTQMTQVANLAAVAGEAFRQMEKRPEAGQPAPGATNVRIS